VELHGVSRRVMPCPLMSLNVCRAETPRLMYSNLCAGVQTAKFRQQLDGLMTFLESSHAHFVRCIKPNSEKRSMLFNPPECLEQLRNSGVPQAVAIFQEGSCMHALHRLDPLSTTVMVTLTLSRLRCVTAEFPFRVPYLEFCERYYMLAPPSQYVGMCLLDAEAPKGRKPVEGIEELRAMSAAILRHEAGGLTEVQLGKTKVFYKGVQDRLLEVRYPAWWVHWIVVGIVRCHRSHVSCVCSCLCVHSSATATQSVEQRAS
jgi:myosin heavy subunit